MYVEDVNDEAPVFTQQQYSRLALRETAGIGTSVIVVKATDRDTGEASRAPREPYSPERPSPAKSLPLLQGLSPSGPLGLPQSATPRPGRGSWVGVGGTLTRCPGPGGLDGERRGLMFGMFRFVIAAPGSSQPAFG